VLHVPQAFFPGFPACITPHVPFGPVALSAALHALQLPVHALLQQKPSAQNPLAHWAAVVQGCPWVAVGWHVPAPTPSQ
jgi:hypothetical protein